MSVKVKNGTPVYGPSLCETCEMQVKFPVRECSRYVSQGRQRLRDMEEIA